VNGDKLRALADEQAALRRVATLVAQGAPPEEVFDAAVKEVGRLLPVDLVSMGRYESDRTMTFVTTWGRAGHFVPVGTRLELGGKNLNTIVFETGRSARLDSYDDAGGAVGATVREGGVRSAAGTPITVEGRLWGMMAAGSSEEDLPPDTEARLASFTELLAVAIANADSRAALARLVEEQAALRRVATLVARGVPPEEVFAAVTEEIGQLLSVVSAALARYEPDGTVTSVAASGLAVGGFPVGSRLRVGGKNLMTTVFETGRPARSDDYANATGTIGVLARETGLRSSVATPIVVEGRLWGAVVAGSDETPLAADIETRLASFTELVATAIANAESRSALAASRARIVAAADQTRRRIERDLHDGIQQRLVSLMLELRPLEVGQHGADELRAQLGRTERSLRAVLEELRELSRGIHPASLSKGGLAAALKVLARRSAVPVELDLRTTRRLPEQLEVAVYYVVSEALTNATKHAHASIVWIELEIQDATLRLAIRDDGVGGADPIKGSGLVGLGDRIEALGGTLQVSSPAGKGTSLLVRVPVEPSEESGAVP
jgi:signal transduction histidine kinase